MMSRCGVKSKNLHAGVECEPLEMVQFFIQAEVTACSPARDADKQKQRRHKHTGWIDCISSGECDTRPHRRSTTLRARRRVHRQVLLGSRLGSRRVECINQAGRKRHMNTKQKRGPFFSFWFTGATEGRAQEHHNSTHILNRKFDLPAGNSGLGKRGKRERKKKRKDRCKSKMVYFVKGAVGGDEKTWCATKWYIQMYMAFKRYYSCHSNVSSHYIFSPTCFQV